MPNSKMKPESATALPWKNSLLSKEEPDSNQNPLNYFADVTKGYDTFTAIWDDIIESRDRGSYLRFFEIFVGHRLLKAFLVVQDPHGINWVCPVFTEGRDVIEQPIRPLNFMENEELPVMEEKPFGTISISLADYMSACSRGFENASLLMMGNQSVRLRSGYRLVAVFNFCPAD